MTPSTLASATATLHPLLATRRSPRAYDPAPLAADEVTALLEAVRWAPSCANEQPWEIYYATPDSPGRAKLDALLAEGNYWAKQAPFLAVIVARKTFAVSPFAPRGEENRFHLYDAGQAAMSLALQAHAMGLIGHQMGGFDDVAARSVLGLSDDQAVAAMIAIGRPGDPATLQERHRPLETAPRERQPIEAFARLV